MDVRVGLQRKLSAKELMLLNWILEKTLESPLDCKEIKPANPKGNHSWIFIGRTDADAPVLWPPNVKSRLIGKDPDAGKDWGQKEKEAKEDEMVGWHHWLDGHEFEQTQGIGDGQGRLACCSPWGRTELDTTEWLNLTETYLIWSVLKKIIIHILKMKKQSQRGKSSQDHSKSPALGIGIELIGFWIPAWSLPSFHSLLPFDNLELF